MSALIEIKALKKSYGKHRVLDHIELSVQPGEFVVLVGGSGSGKTTLLRIAGGLDSADGGEVRLRDQVVDSPERGIWVPPDKRRLGMVFQEYALWPHLSCLDNVVAAIPARQPHRRETALRLLNSVGVAALAARRPQQLSGGQQQRVGIARALAARPDLLLLDEPLSSLDVDTREHLRMEIRRLTHESGTGALFVSHDPLDAWRLADRVVVLEDGRLTQTATPPELYARPATARVARFIGAQGGFQTRLTRCGNHTGIYLGGNFHRATAFDVDAGDEGRVFVRPAGVQTAPDGVPADLMHCAFEAGHYRAYWRLHGLDGAALCSLETAPPTQAESRLRINPDDIFIYPLKGANENV